MRVWWLLSFCCAAVFASAVAGNADRFHSENGWNVPNLDGSFAFVDSRKWESEEDLESSSLTSTPVKFYLFTRWNANKGKQITSSTESVDASNFNSFHPTRFVIHGWIQSHKSEMNEQIRKAWLHVGDYNVIIVDWARARSEYTKSVLAVPAVGRKVAAFIDFLVDNYNMQLDSLHVIGHSLGAHVAGHAGKNVKTGQIQTIVGLDPALPLFSYDNPRKRLAATDAVYVETIHTNGGFLGFLEPIGRAAFYPNGGESQPGCPLDILGICAHERSVDYYAESIVNDNFGSIECRSYTDAIAKDCGDIFSTVRMGAKQNSYVISGAFYVPVNQRAPFGITP